MNHVLLLGYFLGLMVGMWAVVTSFQFYKTYRFSFLRYLIHYVICLNIVLFMYFLASYLRINFSNSPFIDQNSVFFAIMYVLAILVWIGCIHSFIHLILELHGKKDFSKIIRFFHFGFILAGIMCVVGVTSFIYSGSNRWNVTTYIVLMFITIIIFFSGALSLVIQKKRSLKDGKHRSIGIFGWFSLVVYAFFFSPPFLSGLVKIFVLSVAVISLNLAPIIWLRFFFQSSYLQFSSQEDLPPLDTVIQKYQLSAREKEVMELILEGKNNREIEKSLFISYNTVKNHIYNIYRKLGVKNRGQLIRFVLDALKFEKGKDLG